MQNLLYDEEDPLTAPGASFKMLKVMGVQLLYQIVPSQQKPCTTTKESLKVKIEILHKIDISLSK